MHPWMSLYIFNLSMSRIWQDALTGGSREDIVVPTEAAKKTRSKNIPASRYLKSEIVNSPLPDFILDKLADLHWQEREPNMAI